MVGRASVISHPHSQLIAQDGPTGSSRRGSGRPATKGTAARPAASQRKGLAQTRRPARVDTPEDEDEELPDEEEEEEDEEGSFVEEGGQKKKNGKGLAAEVYCTCVRCGADAYLGFDTSCQEFRAICFGV
jgi:hypothetical protein